MVSTQVVDVGSTMDAAPHACNTLHFFGTLPWTDTPHPIESRALNPMFWVGVLSIRGYFL